MTDRPPHADASSGSGAAPHSEPARAGAELVSRGQEVEPPRRMLGGLAAGVLVLVVLAALFFRGRVPTTSHYIALSALLFVTGAVGVLIRRNALVLFMCVELMLNAVNVAFVAFARMHGTVEGHVIVLFVIIVAAAEVAVGLAIIVSIFHRRGSANVDDLSVLRW